MIRTYFWSFNFTQCHLFSLNPSSQTSLHVLFGVHLQVKSSDMHLHGYSSAFPRTRTRRRLLARHRGAQSLWTHTSVSTRPFATRSAKAATRDGRLPGSRPARWPFARQRAAARNLAKVAWAAAEAAQAVAEIQLMGAHMSAHSAAVIAECWGASAADHLVRLHLYAHEAEVMQSEGGDACVPPLLAPHV